MSRFMTGVIFVAFIAPICAALHRSLDFDHGSAGVLLGMVFAIMCGIEAERLTRPFQVCIPSRFQSIRDMVPYAISSEQITWTRDGVSVAIKEIVIEQFGFDKSEYTEDLHFVKDLGLD